MNVVNGNTSFWNRFVPSADTMQSGLMILTVATSILSSMPAYRMTGALALRSVSLASASLNAINTSESDLSAGRIAKCTKVISIALGIVGLSTGVSAYVIAPVALELLIQILLVVDEVMKNCFVSKGQDLSAMKISIALVSFSVNLFGLMALAMPSRGLMIAACSFNLALMLITCFMPAIARWDYTPHFPIAWIIDALCYVILFCLNIEHLCNLSGNYQYTNHRYTYHFFNRTNHPEHIYHPNGQLLRELKPGENFSLELNQDQYQQTFRWHPEYRYRIPTVLKDLVWIKPPLAPELYPTLPLTGPTLTTRDLP